jgi:hypothetical protein
MLGPFIITQLLAAAHPGNDVVIQDNMASPLKDMQMTDVAIKTGVVNGYLHANDICQRIYRDKLESRIGKVQLGLAKGFELVVVRNFPWCRYKYYRKGKAWGS